MLTWAIACMFKRATEMPALFIIGAISGDCWVAYCIAKACGAQI